MVGSAVVGSAVVGSVVVVVSVVVVSVVVVSAVVFSTVVDSEVVASVVTSVVASVVTSEVEDVLTSVVASEDVSVVESDEGTVVYFDVGFVTGLVESSELSVFFVVISVSTDESSEFMSLSYFSSPPITLMSFEAYLNTSLASVALTLSSPFTSATEITESSRTSIFAA